MYSRKSAGPNSGTLWNTKCLAQNHSKWSITKKNKVEPDT